MGVLENAPEIRAQLRRRLQTSHALGAATTVGFPKGPPSNAVPAPAFRRSVPLQEAVPGRESVNADGSRAYLIEEHPDGLPSLSREAFRANSALRCFVLDQGLHEQIGAGDLLLIDLETTGLGSAPLFLIGTLVCENQRWILRQFLARDYSEERAAIGLFLELARAHQLFVSFNGKSFDVPYLKMRAAANGLDGGLEHGHLDLLHAARRIWKQRLPDCRLQTIERHICGRHRFEDVASAEVPDVYHAFVRGGDASRLAGVLRHNRLDLITLADILARMASEPVRTRAPKRAEPRGTMLWDLVDGC